MSESYKYIDIYSDILTFVSGGARTFDEILAYVAKRSNFTECELSDKSADGCLTALRARLGSLLSQMHRKGVIGKKRDDRYFAKSEVPTALREEKCEHEILNMLAGGTMTKENIRKGLTKYFGTDKTRTNRDDNLLNGYLNDTLKRLLNEGVIKYDGKSYSIPREKYAEAGDKKQLSGMRADFLSLLHSRGGEFFEYYFMNLLSRYFKKHGKEVIKCEVTGGSADGGIDGIAIVKDRLGFIETILVQTKNRNEYATELDVRGFYGALNANRGTRGIYAISSGFHIMAKKLLDTLDDCVGIDGKAIFDMAREVGYGIITDGDKIRIDTSII